MSGLPTQTQLWNTRYPSEPSGAPEWMSYHFLREAEICPLAASLKHSWFRTLWARHGYPNRPNVGTLMGIIVHAAAEVIIKSLVAANVTSTCDPRAMATLRSLGGYSNVLSGIIDELVKGEAGNPRFMQVGPAIARTLELKIPQMRETLQQLLASRAWLGSIPMKHSSNGRTDHALEGHRFPLSAGTHFEVTLKDRQAKWKGRLDVVSVSEDGCAISDLKTGSPAPEHQEQMRVYALLWSRDDELNPKQMPVSALELVYGRGLVQVSIPDAKESETFRTQITKRTEAVRKDLAMATVTARPSRENCQYCQVKLLCDDFWNDLKAFGNQNATLSNVVVKAEESRSESTWFARISSSDSSPSLSGRVVLKRFEDGNAFWPEIQCGTTIRLTDVLFSLREPDELPLISLTMLSEALFI